MVEGQSMTTVADVVAQVRDGRLEDFVREAVVLVARELMEGEISAEIGAELGEVAPERRVAGPPARRRLSGCRYCSLPGRSKSAWLTLTRRPTR